MFFWQCLFWFVWLGSVWLCEVFIFRSWWFLSDIIIIIIIQCKSFASDLIVDFFYWSPSGKKFPRVWWTLQVTFMQRYRDEGEILACFLERNGELLSYPHWSSRFPEAELFPCYLERRWAFPSNFHCPNAMMGNYLYFRYSTPLLLELPRKQIICILLGEEIDINKRHHAEQLLTYYLKRKQTQSSITFIAPTLLLWQEITCMLLGAEIIITTQPLLLKEIWRQIIWHGIPRTSQVIGQLHNIQYWKKKPSADRKYNDDSN